MEDEPVEAYNSDSGENDFDMDNDSGEMVNDDREDGPFNWV